MPFISSPVVVPANAPSSPTDAQKRRNDDETPRPAEPKRQRIMGGFVDDDEEEEDEDAMAAFGDAHMDAQFDIPERSIVQEPAKLPEFAESPQLPTPTTATSAPAPAPEPLAETAPDRINTPRKSPRTFNIKTCSGKTHHVPVRTTKPPVPYERLVAGRSTTAPGRAQKSYYGIEIHRLLDDAAKEAEQSKASEPSAPTPGRKWTSWSMGDSSFSLYVKYDSYSYIRHDSVHSREQTLPEDSRNVLPGSWRAGPVVM